MGGALQRVSVGSLLAALLFLSVASFFFGSTVLLRGVSHAGGGRGADPTLASTANSAAAAAASAAATARVAALAQLLVQGQGRSKWVEGPDASGWEWRHGEDLHWTPAELASAQGFEHSACDTSVIREECCVGSTSYAASSKWRKGQCLANTALFAAEPGSPFQPQWAMELGVRGYAGGEPALGALDVLHALPHGASVTLVGDSLTYQYFNNLNCGALRHKASGVKWKKTWIRRAAITNIKRGTLARREARTWLRDAAAAAGATPPTREATFAFQEEWAFADLSIKEACAGADVVILNYGLHWNDESTYRKDMATLPAMLREHCKGVPKIYMGSAAQHFFAPGGFFPTVSNPKDAVLDYMEKAGMPEEYIRTAKAKGKGSFTPKTGPGCTKQRFGEAKSWRDSVALEMLREGFSDVRIPSLRQGRKRLCTPVNDLDATVWFVPVADRMAASYKFHQGGDCTHYCVHPHSKLEALFPYSLSALTRANPFSATTVFDAQHDGLARAIADALGTCDEVNERRDAQGWHDELEHSNIEVLTGLGGTGTIQVGPNFKIPEFFNCSSNDLYDCCSLESVFKCLPM